jgi:hypothetical protein
VARKSVEDERVLDRLVALRAVPAAIRFVSFEPLLVRNEYLVAENRILMAKYALPFSVTPLCGE